jgi:hypothetical protein
MSLALKKSLGSYLFSDGVFCGSELGDGGSSRLSTGSAIEKKHVRGASEAGSLSLDVKKHTRVASAADIRNKEASSSDGVILHTRKESYVAAKSLSEPVVKHDVGSIPNSDGVESKSSGEISVAESVESTVLSDSEVMDRDSRTRLEAVSSDLLKAANVVMQNREARKRDAISPRDSAVDAPPPPIRVGSGTLGQEQDAIHKRKQEMAKQLEVLRPFSPETEKKTRSNSMHSGASSPTSPMVTPLSPGGSVRIDFCVVLYGFKMGFFFQQRPRSETGSSKRKSVLRRKSLVNLKDQSVTKRNSVEEESVSGVSSPMTAHSASIDDEKVKLEAHWNSRPYEFLSWDNTMKISSRSPPLIQTVKGFPLECGNEGLEFGGLFIVLVSLAVVLLTFRQFTIWIVRLWIRLRALRFTTITCDCCRIFTGCSMLMERCTF